VRTEVSTQETEARNYDAAFSPDGTKIAFTSFRDGNGEVYAMDATTGSNPTNLSKIAAEDDHPAFSPDGTKIAFTSYRNGNSEIYTMNARDGSKQQNRTKNAAYDFAPDWGGLLLVHIPQLPRE
jgi:Tol biopolymer transport system component